MHAFGPGVSAQDAPRLAYGALRAVRTRDGRGWGLTSVEPIAAGTYVVEMCGKVVDEAVATVPGYDATYVLGFDDATLARKRAAGDRVRYIDCREQGSMARLANDSEHTPNLALRYVPSGGDGARLPRRGFLVALRDIPSATELTWNCACRPAPPRPAPSPPSRLVPASVLAASR